MRQATLVAAYGKKPDPLSKLISDCQDRIAKRLGICFHRYSVHQVHGTVIGLECVEALHLHNRNLAEYRVEWKTMNLHGYFSHLQVTDLLPREIQIGGFENRTYPFKSRTQRPYLRSFSIQGDKAVLMGWPVNRETATYPETLEDIRKKAQAFYILHSWHRKVEDIDNDLYMRIGLFDPVPTDVQVIHSLEIEMRDMLADLQPTFFEISKASLSVVSYRDEALPLKSSVPWPLVQVCGPTVLDTLYK
jgi:hypothetical protein